VVTDGCIFLVSTLITGSPVARSAALSRLAHSDPAEPTDHLVLQGYVLDLEASLEVMCSGVGLVLAAVGRPPHRGVDDVFGLVTDVE
jgi:hypothetical protein